MITRLSPSAVSRAISYLPLTRVCIRSFSHRKEPIQFPEYNEKTYGADVKKFSQLPTNFGANQHISIDDALKEKLWAVLWKFNAPIRYAFAYGSGVFQQANADSDNVCTFAPISDLHRASFYSFVLRKWLILETYGGLYIWRVAYAALAWTQFGAASRSLQCHATSGERCNKLVTRQFWRGSLFQPIR
jgi:hypothetical protein